MDIWGGYDLVGSLKLKVSFAEYRPFHRALLQKTYNFKEPITCSHHISVFVKKYVLNRL